MFLNKLFNACKQITAVVGALDSVQLHMAFVSNVITWSISCLDCDSFQSLLTVFDQLSALCC